MSNQKDSTQRYRDVIIEQTTRVWTHLDKRASVIPDECEWDDLNEEQQAIVQDTISVEKEWILDEDDWRESTMFKFYDE